MASLLKKHEIGYYYKLLWDNPISSSLLASNASFGFGNRRPSYSRLHRLIALDGCTHHLLFLLSRVKCNVASFRYRVFERVGAVLQGRSTYDCDIVLSLVGLRNRCRICWLNRCQWTCLLHLIFEYRLVVSYGSIRHSGGIKCDPWKLLWS